LVASGRHQPADAGRLAEAFLFSFSAAGLMVSGMGRRGTSLAVACVLLMTASLSGCADENQERLRAFSANGLDLFERGDYDHARLCFESALKLKPDDPDLLYDIGQCYDRRGDAKQAEQFYNDCLGVAPNHAPCHHALAVLLLRQGRRQEADNLIEGWLAREPKLADAYVEDGWRLRQDGDLLAAQGRLQQALDLDPHNVRGLIEMGILYEELSWPARALDAYQQALRLDPNQPEVAQRIVRLKAQGVGQPRPD
jgi:tetratricopeptide (TPR) repeat protein